ncbi:MAG: PEP-CTERM sorting domain-containing protein [Phycisphaerae bacterium]|nr:PEP-CTERM sorting domain-containing protein [Phycisphaerae bacterium]
MNVSKTAWVLAVSAALFVVASAGAGAIPIADVWASSYGNGPIVPEGQPIAWRPGEGQWNSAANPTYGGPVVLEDPDTAPWIAFYFDDLYQVDSMDFQNFWGSHWKGVNDMNVYVSTDGGTTWSFAFDVTGLPTGDGAGAKVDGIAFNEQANAVKFEIVRGGGQSFPFEEWFWNDNGEMKPGWPVGDLYVGIGNVTFFGTPVPEPMTMTLLALGGLALLRRRRA